MYRRLSELKRKSRLKTCIRSVARPRTFGPIVTIIFPTDGIGGFTEIKPSDDTFNDRPADRRPQLFIRVRALPLRPVHDLMYGRDEFRSQKLGGDVLGKLGRLFAGVLLIVSRWALIGIRDRSQICSDDGKVFFQMLDWLYFSFL